ncbi:hypothetical protein IMY05_002G0091600 [Salix suchowensis]|nr:hypothetical protein IMY05_002G0091600 [Salix suchowensis]
MAKRTAAKMKVAIDERFTPIRQDTKKGKLRYCPYNIKLELRVASTKLGRPIICIQ